MADAIIAVSRSTRDDVLRLFDVDPTRVVVIPNGIDIDEYKPTHDPKTLVELGIDPDRPYVLFVGRMTRQKGLYYLLQAVPHFDRKLQVVFCAGDADTLAMQRELEEMVQELQRPVSYTHLDVYKRQDLFILITSLIGSFIVGFLLWLLGFIEITPYARLFLK